MRTISSNIIQIYPSHSLHFIRILCMEDLLFWGMDPIVTGHFHPLKIVPSLIAGYPNLDHFNAQSNQPNHHKQITQIKISKHTTILRWDNPAILRINQSAVSPTLLTIVSIINNKKKEYLVNGVDHHISLIFTFFYLSKIELMSFDGCIQPHRTRRNLIGW